MAATSKGSLTDDHARERVARDHDATIFVEAGAGSGKTTSLVRRLLALVETGVPITAIAAITFTEAAAAELRTRIREELERAVAAAPDDERFTDALVALDDAAISTLHSFAQRILSEFAVSAGIPPAVQIHDELSSVLDFEDRWSELVATSLADEAWADVHRTALVLDVGLDKLMPAARACNQNWDLLEGRAPATPPTLGPLSVDDVVSPLRQALAAVADCSDPDDLLCCHLVEQIGPLVDDLEGASGDRFRLLDVLQGAKIRFGNGRAGSWGGKERKEAVQALLGEADAARAEIRRHLTDQVLDALGGLVADFTLAAADDRRRNGTLEFHDLLVLARRLLRSSPEVHERLHARWTHLLIDEFQDTDPIQIELAVRLAADGPVPADRSWTEIDVPPGRLFFVGDPKQSIYRFRRADVEQFGRAREHLGADRAELVTNFRSVPGIVDAVNAVFDRLFGDGDPAGHRQPPHAPLVAHRAPLADDPGPPVVAFGAAHEDLRADAIREREAADVAALIQRILHEGWLVHDDREGVRAARLDDITILLPSRTSLAHLESALDAAALPYLTDTGTLLYATTQVRDLVSILTAIDDPGDAIALVGALRSPAYSCGDDDLATWVDLGGRWSYLSPLPDGGEHHPVAEAFADLKARHDQRRWQSPSTVLESVVRERRLLEVAVAEPRPRDVLRRYRMLLEHARQFADAERGALRDFLRWIDLQQSDTVRASQPALPEADVHAIRIMTIHGSKGLEFPITIASGMSTVLGGGARGPRVIFGDDGSFQVRVRQEAQTGAFEVHREAEDQMDEFERIRLLYVALTRAKDHLLVSCHHRAGNRGVSLGQRVHGALHDHAELTRFEEAVSAPTVAIAEAPPPPAAVRDGDADRVWSERDAWIRHRSERVVAGARASIAATAVGELLGVDAHPADPVGDEPAAEQDIDPGHGASADPVSPVDGPRRPPWRRGRAGTSVGRAVHAVLQVADLADHHPDDLGALCRSVAAAEGVDDAAADVEAKVRAALAHPVVAAAAAGRHWREVPVGAPVGEAPVLEGFIDLLYEDADGELVVVDYKTDSVRTPAEVDEALARYRPQGAAYALALETVLGRPVRDVVFLFLRGSHAEARSVDDLPAAVAEVRAAIEGSGLQRA